MLLMAKFVFGPWTIQLHNFTEKNEHDKLVSRDEREWAQCR